MKSVLLALCISCLMGLPLAEGFAQEAATPEAKKSTKALEPQPAGEAVQESSSAAPQAEAGSKAASEVGKRPSAEGGTTSKSRPKAAEDTGTAVTEREVAKPKRSTERETATIRRKEMEKERWVPETHKVSPKKEGKESVFSVEEAEKALKEQPSIHKMVSEEEDGALFSVEEAERAGKTRDSVLGKIRKRTATEEALFSVEEAEKAVKRPAVPSKKKIQKPLTEREVKKAKRKARRKALITRRREKEKEKEKWVKIELGFAYKNIQLHQGSYTFETHFIGEMANNTGRNYGIVKFMFSTYDRRGKLISEEPFQITDFYDGQIKTFTGTVVDGFKDIKSHKIRFISAAPTARG